MKRKRVTIVDIARHLGVNDSTVSRALRGQLVSAATVERVRAAARELGYYPDYAARIMVSGRTGMYGLLVPTIDNPFYARFVQASQFAADRSNRGVLLGVYDSDTTKLSGFVDRLLGERRVDGAVFFSTRDERVRQLISAATSYGVPLVAMNRLHAPRLNWVSADYFQAGYLAGEHLCELGHRRIGYMFGTVADSAPASLLEQDERLRGLKVALGQSGVEWSEDCLVCCPTHYQEAVEAAENLLTRDNPPTAVFAINDMLALAVLRVAQGMGLRVPEELAVMGVDNTDEGRLFGLTTIDSGLQQMADLAIRCLDRQVDSEFGGETLLRVTTPVKLVCRETTIPPVPRGDYDPT